MLEELRKAIEEATGVGAGLLRKSQMAFDFSAPAVQPHHVAYLRTNARGTTSRIKAQGSPSVQEHHSAPPASSPQGGNAMQTASNAKPAPDARKMVEELKEAYAKYDRVSHGFHINPDHPDFAPDKYLATAKKILKYKSYEQFSPTGRGKVVEMLNRHIKEMEEHQEGPKHEAQESATQETAERQAREDRSGGMPVTAWATHTPLHDRHGKPLHLGDKIRAQVSTGRYGATKIIEHTITQAHHPHGGINTQGHLIVFDYKGDKGIGYTQFKEYSVHDHETWVEKVEAHDQDEQPVVVQEAKVDQGHRIPQRPAYPAPSSMTTTDLQKIIESREAYTEDFLGDLKPGDKTELVWGSGQKQQITIQGEVAAAPSPEVAKLIDKVEKAAKGLLANPAVAEYHPNIERKLAGLREHPTAQAALQVVNDLKLIAEKAKQAAAGPTPEKGSDGKYIIPPSLRSAMSGMRPEADRYISPSTTDREKNTYYVELDRYRRHDMGDGEDGWMEPEEITKDFNKGADRYKHRIEALNTALAANGFEPNASFDLGEKGHFSMEVTLEPKVTATKDAKKHLKELAAVTARPEDYLKGVFTPPGGGFSYRKDYLHQPIDAVIQSAKYSPRAVKERLHTIKESKAKTIADHWSKVSGKTISR